MIFIFPLFQPVEEPVVGGKEKKRKKLDEIVLGLSAAKGHQDSGPSPSPASSALGAITGSSLFASLSAAASSMAEKQKMPPVTPSISLTAGELEKLFHPTTDFSFFAVSL